MRRFRRLSASFLAVLMIVSFPATVFAEDCSDSQASLQRCGIKYFNLQVDVVCDQNAIPASTGSTSPVPLGADNRESTYNFFISKGLSPEIAAGFVGNFMQESGINPKSVNSIGATGIAQWLGGRKANLVKLPNYFDLTVQLNFVWTELNGAEGSAYNKIKAASGLKDITYAIRKFYERPGEAEANDARRLSEATKALNQFGGGTATVATPGAPDGSCAATGATAIGADTQFVNGYVVYNQYDPAWSTHPYGSSTIAKSGCGPSALAMVITNLTGKRVTPVETADWGTANGMYIAGAGSSHELLRLGPTNWGLKSRAIKAAEIGPTLQQGGLVLASGNGSLPFTKGGHIISIRGMTPDGKLLVGDSGHTATNTQQFEFNQLVSQTSSIWAVTK